MAKRRKGNRKVRRDSKRDSSGLKRIAKVGAVAAGVTLGGAAFLRSDLGKKFIESGIAEAVLKTGKNIKKDLINKPKNLRTLKEVYDKHIGKDGEIFKRELAKQKGKIKKNFRSSQIVKNVHKIEQTKDLVKRKAKQIENNKNKQAFKEYFFSLVIDDSNNDVFEDIIDALYDKTTMENIDNDTLSAHYKKTLKRAGFDMSDTTQINNILNGMYEWKKQNVKSNKFIEDKYSKLAEEIYNKRMNALGKEKQSFMSKVFDKITGTRAATIKDIKDGLIDINDVDFGKAPIARFNNKDHPIEHVDMNKLISNLMDVGDKYDNVILDQGLRVGTRKSGESFVADYRESFQIVKDMMDNVSDTLIGKILLKPWDIGEKHSFGILMPDKLDNMAKYTGATDNMMKEAMVYMNGTLFGLKEDAKGVVSLDIGNRVDVQEVTGWRKHVLHELMGSKQKPAEAYDHPLAQILDINQTGTFNFKETLKRITGRSTDEKWEKNQLQLMKEFVNTAQMDSSVEGKRRLYDSAFMTSVIMNRNITGVSDELLDNMINNPVALSSNEIDMLKLLMEGSDDSLNDFINNMANNLSDVKNEKLSMMIQNVMRDVENADNSAYISMKSSGPFDLAKYIYGTDIDEHWERDPLGQFRVEYVKEILMNKTATNSTYMDYIDVIAGNDKQKETLKNIGMLGLFEQHMQVRDIIADSIDFRFENGGPESQFIKRLQGDYRLMESFNTIMDEGIRSISGLSNAYFGNINETDFYDEFNDIALIKQSSLHPLNIIESINESIKSKSVQPLGKTLLDGLREVTTAGRWDTDHISNLTLGVQYAMSRLNYDLESVGLNLSTDSTSSPLATYLNIGLKRILPVAVGMGAFSYLNDESRRFLGSSITEAAARGLSYADITARRIAYGVPLPHVGKIGEKIDNFAESSVIYEYIFGSNHFQTAEEREDWYENGYSPVRKGRFWSFGSSSEFRGGAISYWQPNYLRRAESNYHDIAIYGSSEEKWAHSWIPTPTHPFSTVRALIDPYWLEKKHLKEGDMPYPLTAKMFSEGTPWGAVLNPTVGEILKPVRMLPEARMRLGRSGMDSQAAIQRINERVLAKEKGAHNDDLIIVSGTDIRNAEYVPFVNPVANELNVHLDSNGVPNMAGYDFMSTVQGLEEYTPPTGEDYVQVGRGGTRTLIRGGTNPNFSYGIYNTAMQTLSGMTNAQSIDHTERIATTLLKKINDKIQEGKPGRGRSVGSVNDPANSTYVYRNLVNEYNNYLDSFYSERYDPGMINHSIGADLRADLAHSSSQISGIYGYLGGMFNNSDHAYTFRYENAGQMSTFSRGFWDASIGGLGGGPMEIARRFFPSEDRSRINVNPLLNNMPDWIPESYHTGNPYTQIPKGEMRLPGKGYEAINDLHPDQFGDYGAFDRYKILADIAPNSVEYKKWRNIAKATVTDPELKEEMEDIAERAAKMSGNHEFFEYKFLRNSTAYAKGVVIGVNNGIITLADHSQLSLAGVTATEQTDDAVRELIQPGTEITYRYEKNKVYDKNDKNKNQATSVVVSMPGSSTSLNKSLIDSGAAKKDVEDRSIIAQLGRISAGQEVSGAIQELIAHAPIPVIHNKFLRVDSAYESYMKETYYGSSFKTWDHPIRAFVTPMFNEQSSKSIASEAISLGVAYFHFTKGVNSDSKLIKTASNIALATTNPTALLGGNFNFIMHGLKNGGKGKGQELTNWQKGAKAGVVIGTMKYAWDNADNPFKSGATMAAAGAYLANTDFGWEVLENIIGKMTTKKGALIGLGIGIGMSALKNSRADSKMFEKWAPKETRKKWELDEYFDRLTYLKYSGLYERAADRARRYEKVDVEGIFEEIDKNKEKIHELNLKAAKLMNKSKSNHDRYAKKLRQIEEKKMMLEEQTQMMFSGGEYTKSAIAYKKKMESTMYGLDPNATKDELLAAVPDQYKDFYTAFMDITDKKEQKKILKSMSPMMRRPLQAAWGMELEEVESNRKYFKKHKLPGTFWRGWKPNVNLKHVKMKTIQNEGMMLADFGYYDSEKAKMTFDDAPEIENYDQGQGPFTDVRIKSIMHGNGIMLHNVSLSKTRAPGIWVVGDVKEKVRDRAKVTGYNIVKTVSTLGSIF